MAIVDGHIRCNACGEPKPLEAFYPSTVIQGCGTCRECMRVAERARRARDPETFRERQRAFRAANPLSKLDSNFRRYGITTAGYEALLAAQGGRCACCGTTSNRSGKRLAVDHDHETGAIRGIICHSCNTGIGSLGDTAEGLRRALNYLERVQQPPPRAVPAIRINLLQGVN